MNRSLIAALLTVGLTGGATARANDAYGQQPDPYAAPRGGCCSDPSRCSDPRGECAGGSCGVRPPAPAGYYGRPDLAQSYGPQPYGAGLPATGQPYYEELPAPVADPWRNAAPYGGYAGPDAGGFRADPRFAPPAGGPPADLRGFGAAAAGGPPAGGVCPVTGAKLGSMGEPVRVTVAGRDVWLCCAGCEAKLRQDPARYLSGPAAGPTAPPTPAYGTTGFAGPAGVPAPARATAADAAAILRQGTCPVMGDQLDPQGEVWKVWVQGRPVYVCCRTCIRQLTDRPQDFLASAGR